MTTAAPYVERLAGETYFRSAPSAIHEYLCDHLSRVIAATLPPNSTWKLQERRHAIPLAPDHEVRPDLSVLRVDATGDAGRPVLVVEVLLPGDHHPDTVIKKGIYQAVQVPTLWMVDPRYLNVEIYRRGPWGFRLEAILAHTEQLTDPHLPGLALSMDELFARS